jgi:hypothetical protein
MTLQKPAVEAIGDDKKYNGNNKYNREHSPS